MKKSRFGEEQMVNFLRETDRDPVAEVAKRRERDTERSAWHPAWIGERGARPGTFRDRGAEHALVHRRRSLGWYGSARAL
jgi:hypothetical protein